MVGWRWAAVAAGAAALVALPPVVGALPARDSSISAAELLSRVQRSASADYAGYAEAVGGLRLPLTDDFAALTDLFGDRTRLRVWWRGEQDWRVDTLDPTGETGLRRDFAGLWTWQYERGTSVRTTDPPVRLPRGADLDPAALGRRLLSEARPDEVSRLPARRVAGVNAPGLRVRPADPGTTVDRVDVWADAGTGLALRVEVHAGGSRPIVETAFLDIDLSRPPASVTDFNPPYPGRTRREVNPDLAAAIDVLSPVEPPASLAGLPRRRRVEGLGAVGTYGTGLTVLVAIPLPGRISRPLQEQLARTPGARLSGSSVGGGAIHLTVGPLSVLLTDPPGRRGWLFTGTVAAATLDRAAADIARTPPEPR